MAASGDKLLKSISLSLPFSIVGTQTLVSFAPQPLSCFAPLVRTLFFAARPFRPRKSVSLAPRVLQTHMFEWTFNQPLHAPWYYYGRFGDLAMS